MPDLAVEIASPSNTSAELRQKAALYLQHGSLMVWLVLPDQNGVEVCHLGEDGQLTVDFIGRESRISGGAVLPGFELEIRRLFPAS